MRTEARRRARRRLALVAVAGPCVLCALLFAVAEALSRPATRLIGDPPADIPLLWPMPLISGAEAAELRPIQQLPRLGAPVLIASGAEDRHTTWTETQRVFDAAIEPKEIWRVEGAAHVDLHAFEPTEYERRVLPFLAKHLRRQAIL